MLTLLAIFGSSFVIALSGALMPGPLLTVAIRESSRRGFVAGPLLILGHGILELVLVVALLLGLAPLIQHEKVFAGICLAGGLVLLGLALGMLRSLPRLRLEADPAVANGHQVVTAGILYSLANPYWTIWWATIGLGYIIAAQRLGWWGVAFFFAGHILADLAWYSAVTAAVSRGRRLLTDGRYRALAASCAVVLVLFAGYFLYSGLAKIL